MLNLPGVRQTGFESGGFLFVASAAAAIVLGVLISADPQGHGFALALGTIVAAMLAVATIRNPAFGGYVLVGAVPVISGLKRGLFVPGLRPSEVLIGGLATLILVTAPVTARRPWRTFDWLALSYCFATLILGSYDLLQRGVAFNGDIAGKLLGPFQFFLFYRAVIVALPSQKQLARAIIVLLALSLPVALLAILQHFDLMSSRAFIRTATGTTPSDLSKDPGFVIGNRATGPFPAWHTLGGYLVVIVLVSVACLFEGFQNRRIKLASTIALLLAVPALFATGTAAPILGAAAGCLLLGLWLGRLKRAVVIVLTGTLLVAFLFAPLIEKRYGAQYTGQETVH
ncbi:MAG: hypothetical protein M3P18_10140, partial [Actinomycetota bacterium]|nr:hypothetical protein [Actinomycetota bacterium]